MDGKYAQKDPQNAKINKKRARFMSFFAEQGDRPMFSDIELDRIDEIEDDEYQNIFDNGANW